MCRSAATSFSSTLSLCVLLQTLHVVTATETAQEIILFCVYRTEAFAPKHTTEAGMFKETSMRLVIANPQAVTVPSAYKIEVKLKFGGTEFAVTVRDKQTQRFCSVKVAFAHGK